MIYIAAPYYDSVPAIRKMRMEYVYLVMRDMLKDGKYPVSPLTMHPVVDRYENDVPGTFDFWDNYCFDMLKHCESVIVLKLPGWERSRGVKAEIEFCEKHDIPVTFHDVPSVIRELHNFIVDSK